MPTHEPNDSYRKAKASSDRAFGLVFTAVFLVVGLAHYPFGGSVRWWALVVAVAFAAVAVAYPTALKPLNRLWTRFALLLHHITNPVIMGVVFFSTVLPTGIVMRARGRDLLSLKRQPEAPSYWIPRTPGPQRGSMIKQF